MEENKVEKNSIDKQLSKIWKFFEVLEKDEDLK